MYDSNVFYSDLMNSSCDTAILFLQQFGEANYSTKIMNNTLNNKGTSQDTICNINNLGDNYFLSVQSFI